jgi:hypothetical protein
VNHFIQNLSIKGEKLMAADKKIKVGVVITTYSQVEYLPYNHRYQKDAYQTRYFALYMHNRRERTSGVTLPRSFEPILQKFGIKCIYRHNSETLIAVGCRVHCYYTAVGKSPYPDPENVKKASEALEAFKATCLVEGEEQTETNNSGFLLITYTERKLENITNKDVLSMLYKPIEQYIYNEQYM